MPLKHRTETALLLLLAFVMCVAGAVVGILRPLSLPTALTWILACGVFLSYPLALRGMLRRNRADYEFRALHWFPFFIVAAWGMLSALLTFVPSASVVFDGLFTLWSLPFVGIGLGLLALFSFHVLRRRRIRLCGISVLFIAYACLASLSSSMGIVPLSMRDATTEYSTVTFRELQERVVQGGLRAYDKGRRTVSSLWHRTSQASVTDRASSEPSLSTLDFLQVRPTFPPMIAETPPSNLAGTGPVDSAMLLALLLLAAYCATLHRRARRFVAR